MIDKRTLKGIVKAMLVGCILTVIGGVPLIFKERIVASMGNAPIILAIGVTAIGIAIVASLLAGMIYLMRDKD